MRTNLFLTEFQIDELPALDALRAESPEKLKDSHQATARDMIPTIEPTWGTSAKLSAKSS